MKALILWILRKMSGNDYYSIDELVIWGNCGLCGKSMEGIFPAYWNWGVCDSCKGNKN